MAFDEVIQLDESVEYPEGYNAIVVEGTGDEGGIEMFVKVRITVTPASITADGEAAFGIMAEVFDPSNPTAIECHPITEETSAPDQWYVETGSLIKSLTGVWYSEGNNVKGDEITNLVKTYDQGGTIIEFSSPLDRPLLIIEYIGNDGVSFDTSNPLLEFQNREDSEFELPSISGEFKPVPPIMVDDIYDPDVSDEQNYAKVYTTFVPAYDQNGIGYITAKWRNGYATALINVIGGPATFDIDIKADPSAIPTYSHSKIMLTVTQSGEPVSGKSVTFSIWDGGEHGYIRPTTTTLKSEESVEEVTTSKDFSTMTSYLNVANPIISITKIMCLSQNVTAYASVDPDDRTRINFDPAFGFEEVICEVTYEYGGVAFTFFYSNGEPTEDPVTQIDNPVIIRGACEGRDKVCSVTVTPGSDKRGLTIAADPSSLPLRTGPLPPHGETMPPDNGESYLTIALEDPDGLPLNGATVHLIVSNPESGGGTISPSSVVTKTKEETETATPSDAYHVSVAHPISSVASVKQMGDTVAVASFNGKEIAFSSPLPHLLEDCVIEYTWGGFGGAYYTPPEDYSGQVAITATYKDWNPARCTISIDSTPEDEWGISIEVAMPEIAPNWFTTVKARVFIEYPPEPPLQGQEPEPSVIVPQVGETVTFWLSNPEDRQVGGFNQSTTLKSITAVTDSEGYAEVTYYSGADQGTEVVVATAQQSPLMDPISAYTNIVVRSDVGEPKYAWKFLMGTCSGSIVSAADTQAAEAAGGLDPLPEWEDRMNDLYHPRYDSLTVELDREGVLSDLDRRLSTNLDPLANPMIISLRTPWAPMPYVYLEWEGEVTGGKKVLWVMDSMGTTFESKNTTAEPTKSEELKEQYRRNGGYLSGIGCNFYYSIVPNYTENKREDSFPIQILNGGQAIAGVEISIAGKTETTNDNGIATFKDLPEGTHKVQLRKAGYLLSTAPDAYTPTAKWDADTRNDTVTVYEKGKGALKITQTDIQCSLYCTVHTDSIYTDTGYSGKGYEFLGEG